MTQTTINSVLPVKANYERWTSAAPIFNTAEQKFIFSPLVLTEKSQVTVKNVISKKTPTVTIGYRSLLARKQTIPYQPYLRSENFDPGAGAVGFKQIYESYPQVGSTSGGAYLKQVEYGAVFPSGPVPGMDLDIASHLNVADIRAIQKLRDGIKDSKFNSAQAYAESSQVQRLIGDLTKKLAVVLENLRKGKLGLASNALGLKSSKRANSRYSRKHRNLKSNDDIDKMLASGVLSVQYGIRPLISDVIGAAELYAQKQCAEVVNSFRASAQSGNRDSDNISSNVGTTYHTIINCDASGSVECTVKYGVRFSKGSEVVHTLKQLGLTNPFLLAWELLPWSFVFDWVLPIGPWLSSLDATLGLDFVGGYKSVRIKRYVWTTTKWSPNPSRSDQNSYEIGTSLEYTVVNSFERTVLNAFPLPRFPVFKNPASWEHALNGMALLAGIRKNVYIR